MTLFDANGHLAQQALQALHEGSLSEAQRLATSEHLCSCEACFERYTQSLTEERLLAPPQPLAPGVAQALKARARKREKLLGIAACACAFLWLLALLTLPSPPAPQPLGLPVGEAVEMLRV